MQAVHRVSQTTCTAATHDGWMVVYGTKNLLLCHRLRVNPATADAALPLRVCTGDEAQPQSAQAGMAEAAEPRSKTWMESDLLPGMSPPLTENARSSSSVAMLRCLFSGPMPSGNSRISRLVADPSRCRSVLSLQGFEIESRYKNTAGGLDNTSAYICRSAAMLNVNVFFSVLVCRRLNT